MINSLPKIQYSIGGITYDVSNIFKQLQYTIPPTKIFTTTVEYGERPDQISNRLYGTPDYYWSIILANKDNPFINPIERLGESTKTTLELEAGEDIDPRDFFIQFSRSAFDVYIDDIAPVDFAALGLTGNTELTDHRVVDFYKSVIPGDIIVYEPYNENVFSFGGGQQKLGTTGSDQYYSQYGQSSIPDRIIKDNIKIFGAAAGDKWSAILDTNGNVHFWGNITLSGNLNKIEENYYKSTTSGYTFISSSEDLLLAIRTSDGGVTCFGNCGRFNNVYNNQKNFKKIVWSKGITGFGLGISGNASYSNIVSSDTDYGGITFTVSGTNSLYIFGGITAVNGLIGLTAETEQYFSNNRTVPFDIGCTDVACYCGFNDYPNYYENINSNILGKFKQNVIIAAGDESNYAKQPFYLSNIVEYTINGLTAYYPADTIKNTLEYKTYFPLFEAYLQTMKNNGYYSYNSTTKTHTITPGLDYTQFLRTYTQDADELDHTNKNYTRNTNFWLTSIGIDCTSIPVWQSTSDGWGGDIRPEWTRGGIPITRQHIIACKHFPPSVGSVFRWVTNNNTVVERTLIGYADPDPHQVSDRLIGILDSPLPIDINIPKVWNTQTNRKYADPNGRYFVVKSNQYRHIDVMPSYIKSLDGFEFRTYNKTQTKYKIPIFNSYLYGGVRNLDSGSPSFIIFNGELILLGLVATTSGGWFLVGTNSTNTTITPTMIQTTCDNLSNTYGKNLYNINWFNLDEVQGFLPSNIDDVTSPLYYNIPRFGFNIQTNKKNVFFNNVDYKKYVRFDEYYSSEIRWKSRGYITSSLSPGNNETIGEYNIPYWCFGPDKSTFHAVRNNNIIPDLQTRTPGRLLYCAVTNRSVFLVKIPDFGILVTQYGDIKKWQPNIVTTIGLNINIFPSSFKANGSHVLDLVDPDTLLPYRIPAYEPPNTTCAMEQFSELQFVGGGENIILASLNKTPQATPNYFQVTFVDSAFKRLFVKDLNGNAQSFINSDPACSRFSIIRKDANGTYRIIKLQNNSLRGIMSSKALRTISKVYDLSNANPSNEQTWNDYLSLLESYMNGTLSTLGGLPTINTSINGNPVEIKYYQKEYVAELASNIPKLLKL